ncbi:MAG: serine hydrolase [Longimicrobiales bacterium]
MNVNVSENENVMHASTNAIGNGARGAYARTAVAQSHAPSRHARQCGDRERITGAGAGGHGARSRLLPVLSPVLRSRFRCLALALALPASVGAQATIPVDARYRTAAADLEQFIQEQLREHGIPAISIALVDDQRVVWARGFGYQKLRDSIPATAETVHRVGSVSKLFTDIGVMQLVERGQLSLDVPIQRYLPLFAPANPHGRAITLRQLMSHRSGLLREPPVGNYFDPTGPPLAAMVRSLDGRALVHPPEQRLKYSNAAIAVVGYVLEQTQKEPFAAYLKRTVLDPMGLRSSAFEPLPALRPRIADAVMWTVDNRVFAAPTFQLGMAPAGSMYSTVLDLGTFMSTLFNGGRAPNGNQLLKRETLEEMWRPQFTPAGTRTGGGLGFFVADFQGHRVVRHGGAIYGFATELAALPERKLGVAVVATKDIANVVSERIANRALELMLGGSPAQTRVTRLAPGRARAIEGRYARGERVIELHARDDRLFLDPGRNITRMELWALSADTLIANDALSFGLKVAVLTNAIAIGADTFPRADLRASPSPSPFLGLIGEYGWDHNTLYILEKEGKLHALIEWFFEYPLEAVARDTFRFPNYGLYDNETIIFKRDAQGRAFVAEAANVLFTRRLADIESGQTFKIKPLRPVQELRQEALAATPPVERGDFLPPDLVELRALDPAIRYDIRYATTNNFMDAVFYSQPRAFLQRPAAQALLRAHVKLKAQGFGLLIHDAYRPWYVTKMFWDATPEAQRQFVANPANGSRHNRGAAVDLTLYDLRTGEPVQMVGGYDEFSERSYPDYPGGTSRQRWLRELLRDAMETEGFKVYEFEWWHFDYGEWRRYPIQNLTFEQIGR